EDRRRLAVPARVRRVSDGVGQRAEKGASAIAMNELRARRGLLNHNHPAGCAGGIANRERPRRRFLAPRIAPRAAAEDTCTNEAGYEDEEMAASEHRAVG
ncbi:MAG: hypothetical protein L6Q76_21670, partial [Polyangiaceae bacterium]|nr:hypothetical protein [Polyangiaceae bacterium]